MSISHKNSCRKEAWLLQIKSEIQWRAAPLSPSFCVTAELMCQYGTMKVLMDRHPDTRVQRCYCMVRVCVRARVSDRRLRDDCLAAARSFNPALSLPPSPALNWVTGDDGPSEGNFNYHDSIRTDGEIDSSLKRCHLQAESHLQAQRWVQTGSRITVWSEDLVR